MTRLPLAAALAATTAQAEPTSAEVPDGEVFHFIVTWMGG